MANPRDRVTELEADNAALRREVTQLRNSRDDERRRRESTSRGYESLVQNMMGNIESMRANGGGAVDPQLVDDILKEAGREKENLQHKIRDLERRLDEERRRGYDYSSAEQLRIVQRQLDTVRDEKIELEYKLNEERRKKDELGRRLDNPQESSRIRALDSQIEYLQQDNWKLKERIRDETRYKEEWRNKYEQAVHYRSDEAALDDLKRRILALNQEKFTLNEDWRRERESFQRRIRQFEDDLKGKTAVENVHRLRSENDRLKERYQQEREENDNLHKRLEILSQQENEVFALKGHIAKLEKELMELNVSRGTRQSDLESEIARLKIELELNENRTKEQCSKISDMAYSIKTLENEKVVTETKLQTVLHEKKEIERRHSQTQQQQPQFNGDTTEEVKRLRDQVQTLQAQLYHRQPPAANNEHLTAEIQRLEAENKVLRKQCNEYVEETRQLRERSTSFLKSEHPPSENEYLTRTIENMKQDYDRLKERCQLVEEESETYWRRAEENKRKYDETFQKMRNLKNSFSEERQMLEREKEQVVIENSWLNEELCKAMSEAAAQPKRTIFSSRMNSLEQQAVELQQQVDASQKQQAHLRKRILELQLRGDLESEVELLRKVQYEVKEKYEAEIAELKQKMKEEKAALEGDLPVAYDKMQKCTSSSKKQLFVFAEELLSMIVHSDSTASTNAHSYESGNVITKLNEIEQQLSKLKEEYEKEISINENSDKITEQEDVFASDELEDLSDVAEAAEKATSSSDDLKDKDLLIAKLLRKTNKTSENQSKSFSIGIQCDYTVRLLDLLCDVQVASKELFVIQGDEPQLINWKKFGLRLGVSEGSLPCEETAEIAVAVLVGGQFEFPFNTVLVSAVYGILVSRPLLKPLRLDVQHCVDLTRVQPKYLKFGIAPITSSLPYKFSIVDGGEFSEEVYYGSIYRKNFSHVAIFGSLTNGEKEQHNGEEEQHNGEGEQQEQHEEENGEHQNGGEQQQQHLGEEEGQQQQQQGDGQGQGDGQRQQQGDGQGQGDGQQQGDGEHQEEEEQEGGGKLQKEREGTKNDSQQEKKQERQIVRKDVSTGVAESMIYAGLTFHEQIMEGETLMTFTAAKNLNALIQFVKDNQIQATSQSDINFYIQDSKYIELVLDHTAQKYPITGWIIRPCSEPCRLFRKAIDSFEEGYPPTCKITAYASPNPTIEPKLHYAVPLKGVVDPVTIYIRAVYPSPSFSMASNTQSRTSPNTAVASKRDEVLDVNTMKKKLKQILDQHHADLDFASKFSLDNIAKKLFQVEIITEDVRESPTYDNIIKSFEGVIRFVDNQPDLEDKLEKFLSVLSSIGGPLNAAATMLRKKWKEIKDTK